MESPPLYSLRTFVNYLNRWQVKFDSLDLGSVELPHRIELFRGCTYLLDGIDLHKRELIISHVRVNYEVDIPFRIGPDIIPAQKVSHRGFKFDRTLSLNRLKSKVISVGSDLFSYGRLLKSERPNKVDLSKSAGVTFVVRIVKGRTMLCCMDYGGIYDSIVGSEGEELNEQVCYDLYATQYALAVFSLYKDLGLENSYEAALHFCERYHLEGPIKRQFFRHIEFRNHALINTRDLGANAIAVDNVYFHRYDPINVLCLRINMLSNLKIRGLLNTRLHLHYLWCIRRVSRNLSNGHLQDNFRSLELASNGLSYHFFGLACLIDGAEFLSTSLLQKIQTAAVFSADSVASNGDVAYLGRGANGIYHWASAIFFFYKCHSVFQIEMFKECAELILHRYENLLRKNGLSTCLSGSNPRHRFSWNQAMSSYIAQSAYFLAKCEGIRPRKHILPNCQKLYPTHAFVRANDVYFCLAESRDFRPWSGGTHISNIGGLAYLSICNEPFLLHLDCDVHNNLLVAVSNKSKVSSYSQLPITRIKDCFSLFQDKVKIKLECRENQLVLMPEFNIAKNNVLNLPLKGKWDSRFLAPGNVELSRKKLKVKIMSSGNLEIAKTLIENNSIGYGELIEIKFENIKDKPQIIFEHVS